MTTLPPHLREFDDMATTRKWLYEDTASALKSTFPYEDDEWKLELDDVSIDDQKEYDLRKQKEAIIANRRMPVPVKGTWRLTHKPENRVVAQHSGTLMNLPYITDRGTYVYNGNEYSMLNQSRLKPGAYTRVRRSGEAETMFNVRPRTGRTFRLIMEPNTGVFKFDMGGSSIPAIPLLKAMGVPDEQVMESLGADLTAVNMKAAGDKAMGRIYQRIAGRKVQQGLSNEQQQQQIREMLESAELDPDVVRRTMGIDADHITGPILLRAMQKMRNIQRGEERPDDRDAPKFSNVHGVEDLIPERISKDAGNLARQLFWAAKKNGNLKKFEHAPLNQYVDEWMLKSRLTMPLEETNPLSLLEQMNRITKLGEGGIGSADSITDEARDVNPGQTGFIDLVAGPEGTSIGIDVRTAFKTYKGRDRQMYAEFRNPKTGQVEYHKPEELDGLRIAFPGDLKREGDTVQALFDGELQEVPKDQVDLEIPSLGHMNHAFANLNPMPTAYQSARAFYGAKFWGQYLPQAKGEVPLVDSVMPDQDRTFSEYYGRRMGSLTSPIDGTVTKIDGDLMHIRGEDGKTRKVDMVKAFPFNRLTGISYFPMVEEGTQVKAGDPVAHSNFTDKKTGSLTLGQNLRTAMLPYRGHSYEDSQVISASAAKKMATERLYGFETTTKDGIQLDKKQYQGLFPKKFSRQQLENIDDHGVVKPGTVLRPGDPIMLATGPKLLSAEDAHLGRLHRVLKQARTDRSEVWEHNYDGVVTDVNSGRSGAKVYVAAAVPVQVGDKLSGRHGLKGTVGRILEDEEMPKDPVTGLPYEFLINPMGIQSRVAPAAIMEMQLGRIARLTGKQFRIPQEPPEEGWEAWVDKQLKEHGLEAKVPVFDPQLGRALDEPVQAGESYIMAFHHLSDKKESARGSAGLAYTHEDQPAKGQGSARSAKRLSSMDLNALLAHGASEVINDAILIRGARNDEYFRALRQGLTLPKPKVPMIYEKMLETLKAGGINIDKKQNLLELMPMTDKDIDKLSAGPIRSSKMVDRNLQPVKGGLFDPGLTGGGLVGNRWTHIELPEPMPNPIFEEPIRRMLGLTQKKLEGIISHTDKLGDETGGVAIRNALQNMDIDAEIKKHRQIVQKSRGANRDNSIKILGYLDTLKRQGHNPGDWMINKVPVLPPKFRPISQMGDVMLSADMNELYQSLIETGDAVKAMQSQVGDEDLADDRALHYAALKAVTGLGEPVTPEGQARRLKGALRQVIGDQPKTGMMQSRVLSKTVDLVGRGVVSPDPNLDMDTIGIPEDSAWTLYKDFITRRLRQQNVPMTRALEMYEERHPYARRELLKEMETRPVMVDRAPTWHKFNFMAFRPIPIEGSVIRTPPLINKSFTLDHDGDYQINVNFVAIPKKYHKKHLTGLLPASILQLMRTKHAIPTLSDDYYVGVVDLEDFPHGELSNHKVGRNGPIDFYTALPGTKVLALDEHKMLPVWADVSYVSSHPGRLLEIVTLANGKQIYTDDDPRAVYGIDPLTGEFVRCTPSDAVERKIVVPHVKNAECIGVEDMPAIKIGGALPELPMTWDAGYMLGALAGDGWWDRKHYAFSGGSFSCNEDDAQRTLWLADLSSENATTLLRILSELSKHPVDYSTREETKTEGDARYGRSIKHRFAIRDSLAFTEWLSANLGGDRGDNTSGSGNKHLPAWAFLAPRAVREGILCGLIDTDGTCCTTHRVGYPPQLSIAFTSTSFRLARDTALLSRTLGIEASIAKNKETVRGTTAWLVTLSAVDSKQADVFTQLQRSKKREAFIGTPVDEDKSFGNQSVVLPTPVFDYIRPWVRATAPKSTRELSPHEFADRSRRWSLYQQLYRAAESKVITRTQARNVLDELEMEGARVHSDFVTALRIVDDEATTWDDSTFDLLRTGLLATVPRPPDSAHRTAVRKLTARIAQCKAKKAMAPGVLKDSRTWLVNNPPPCPSQDPIVRNWRERVVENESITWSPVESVEKTGVREDGYDLTVPGYETFTSLDGIVLSNTMNFHVMVDDKAAAEAWEKMRPSRNLVSLTDLQSPRYGLEQEFALGLYRLTKDPDPGQPVQFANRAEAEAAYRRGEIKLTTPIVLSS